MKRIATEPTKEEEKERNNLGKNQVFSWGSIGAEASGRGCISMENAVWVDAGDCVQQEALGILKYSLVGNWKTRPEFLPVGKELEAWARVVWRLEGGVMISYLNENLMFLEFESLEEAKWVLESVRRSFKGDLLQLEWWSLESVCIRQKATVKEAWIRVVGLPLLLWTPEILKKIGDACGGFLALEKETTLRTKVMWARILVKLVGKTRPSVVNILEGLRSFELQIWWEILHGQ